MREILINSAYFGALLSLAAYFAGAWLHKKLKLAIFNPILIGALLTIGALLLLGVDYSSYNVSAKYLSYLLTPATVCLAIPLYEQIALLKKHLRAMLAGILAGVLANLAGVLCIALLWHLGHAEYATLLPKSVTTAIGMPLAESMGGYPSITAVIIMLTGVVGNMCAPGFLKLLRITSPLARGVAIGTSSHALGTTKALEMGEIEGAMSSLSIAVAGLMTVIAASIFAGAI